MPYQLNLDSQSLGNKNYIAHDLDQGEESTPQSLLSEHVANFGIIQLGELTQNQTSELSLAQAEINSPILIRSVYAFATNAVSDSILFRVLDNGAIIAQLSIPTADMPYEFPYGAILLPNHTISVRPAANLINLNVYWQPVNIIHSYKP